MLEHLLKALHNLSRLDNAELRKPRHTYLEGEEPNDEYYKGHMDGLLTLEESFIPILRDALLNNRFEVNLEVVIPTGEVPLTTENDEQPI